MAYWWFNHGQWWLIMGLSLDYHWIIIGLSLDYPWIITDTMMVNNGKSLITVDNIEILNRVLNRIPSSVLKCDLLGNPRTSHGGFFAGKINKWSWFPEGFFLPIPSHSFPFLPTEMEYPTETRFWILKSWILRGIDRVFQRKLREIQPAKRMGLLEVHQSVHERRSYLCQWQAWRRLGEKFKVNHGMYMYVYIYI